MSLARNLAAARAAAGLSQQKVADATGIPRPGVSDIERGKREVSAPELKALADLYRTTADELLGRDSAGSEGREEFQVAVTVFVTARGVDQAEAQHDAESAVRHALRSVAVEHSVLETPHRTGGSFRVRVHKVMDTTTAGINGYLEVRPTNRAYREGS